MIPDMSVVLTGPRGQVWKIADGVFAYVPHGIDPRERRRKDYADAKKRFDDAHKDWR